MSLSLPDFAKLLGQTPKGWGRTTITYSFLDPANLPSYDTDALLAGEFGTGIKGSDAKAVTAAQQAAFLAAIQPWMAVANINLVAAPAGGVGDIAVGAIRFGNKRSPTAQAATVSPIDGSATPTASGDVWISDREFVSPPYLTPGGLGYFSILHEIGHALGLFGDKDIVGQKFDSWRFNYMTEDNREP
jgi:predicted Zn-dependent protease